MPDAIAAARPAADAAAPMGVEERLAVLEERTRPKPKGWLDLLKEWGGAGSLAIALLYSFPLGVWDRFVVSREERAGRELAELRGVLDKASEIFVQGAEALGGLQDPTLYDLVTRSTNNRIFLVMEQREAAFSRRRADLRPTEQVMTGLLFATANKPARAVEFLEAVPETADPILRAEAARQLAKIHFLPSRQQDADAARGQFRRGLDILGPERSPLAQGMRLDLLGEWGGMEMRFGDWSCGQRLINDSIRQATSLGDMLGDRGNTLRLLVQEAQSLQRAPGQPAAGCPVEPPPPRG